MAPPQGGPDNQITGYELVYRRADDTEEVRMKGGTAGLMDNRLKNRCMTEWMVRQTEDGLISILKDIQAVFKQAVVNR